MKQVLTNVYDNCEITDANVYVCGGRGGRGVVGDKRRRLHSLFHCPPFKRATAKLSVRVQRSSTPCLSWIILIIILTVLRGLVLVVIEVVIFFSEKRAVESKRAG